MAVTLEQAGISYALGGALAYGQYGVPRATNDVDVNVFLPPDALGRIFGALRALGIDVDSTAAEREIEREGMLVVRWGDYRLAVFLPSMEFSWEAERTRVRHVIDGKDVWFLSVEALCVFKLLFFRPKDIVDLERLIAVQGSALNAAYVREKLVGMLGPDDDRVRTWDRLLAEHLPS